MPVVSKEQADSTLLKLLNEIDQYLEYPQIFWEHGIYGQATVRLVFDKEGLYQEKLSKVKSTDKFIKVQVTKVLRKALKDRSIFTQKMKLAKEFFTVDAEFIFEISSYADKKSSAEIKSGALSFYRLRYGEGSSVADTTNYRVRQVVETVSNPLVLWKYRPRWLKSDRELVNQIIQEKKFQEYKDDPAWDENDGSEI